jgi:hypothetical protein
LRGRNFTHALPHGSCPSALHRLVSSILKLEKVKNLF